MENLDKPGDKELNPNTIRKLGVNPEEIGKGLSRPNVEEEKLSRMKKVADTTGIKLEKVHFY